MNAPAAAFPRLPMKRMDGSMLFFELDRQVRQLMPEHVETIASAASLASFLHKDQTRFVRGDMPRVPYIEHPLRVALRLVRWGVRDCDLLVAALLHDTIEDCSEILLDTFGHRGETPLECLGRLYGDRVGVFVQAVTNPTDGTSYLDHINALARSGSLALAIKASDLKDNAASIRHQMGFGQDDRMLRMARKYAPALGAVTAAVETLPIDQTVASAVLTDLQAVARDVTQIIEQHDREH